MTTSKPRSSNKTRLAKYGGEVGEGGSFPVLARHPPKKTCSFHQFFAIWAELQGWQIPDFHIDICDFLTNHDNWENNTGLVQIFRGAAKSTITSLFITWLLTQDPTLRFMVLSADKETAMKMTTDIKMVVMQHPFARHLHGSENTWRTDKIVVNGHNDGRNPNVVAWGILSNVTGSRADWVIYDDVEVPKNCATEGDRDKLRKKLNEPVHILVPGGKHLFIGTPHSFDSIYTELEGNSTKDNVFRAGKVSQIKIPLMRSYTGEFPTIVGESTWPERFTLEEILMRQNSSGTKGEFLSQYLLIPYNPQETVLDPTLISVYDSEVDILQSNGSQIARINDVRLLGVTAYWDPSLAKLSSDDSVFSVVFTTEDGHAYIHRAMRIDGDADEQCDQIIREMLAVGVSHVIIETNGVGGFLPPVFRKRAEGKGVTCEGKQTTRNKLEKINHAYEVRLASGRIHAHKSVMAGKFRTQLRDFSPRNVNRQKDDFIDCVAMAILEQPIRIKTAFAGARANTWQSAIMGGSIEAPIEGITW